MRPESFNARHNCFEECLPIATTVMKIAIIGNCQRVGIGHCMKAMQRELEIKEIDTASVIDGSADLENSLKGCDCVISQKEDWTTNFVDPIVVRYQYNLIYCPRIYFDAFHPDLTYVQKHG